MKQLSKDTKVYEGAGKMYVISVIVYALSRNGLWLWRSLDWMNADGLRLGSRFRRFVLSPSSEMEKRLASDTAVLKSDISNLNKKLHYLETTYKNSREHIDQILKSGGRLWRWRESRTCGKYLSRGGYLSHPGRLMAPLWTLLCTSVGDLKITCALDYRVSMAILALPRVPTIISKTRDWAVPHPYIVVT